MLNSIHRIFIIAHNSLLELLRQKILLLIILFGIVCIASGNAFSSFTPDDQIRFIKDFSFGAMSIFGLLLAILGSAQMIQAEIERRTIYTILSKPIRRWELLWGKFTGICLLILLSISLMTVVFVIVLYTKDASLAAELHNSANPTNQELVDAELQRLHAETHDPEMIQAWCLMTAKLVLTTSLATLVSTVATSTIFTVSMTFLIYLVGHLQAIARDVWFGPDTYNIPTWWQKLFSGLLAILVPDFNSFGIMDDILAGNIVHWSYTLNLLFYTLVYTMVVMGIGQLIFNEREW